MAGGPSPPAKPGLSLYANLLDPSANSTPGTISSAPVTYARPAEGSPEQDDAAKKQQALAASLRFQPTKRPQLAAQKAKAKAIASKFAPPSTAKASATPPPPPNEEGAPVPQTENIPAQALAPKTSIADWTATTDDYEANSFYGEKAQRGGRKKRKKNREAEEIIQNWDDIYDPSRPNSYEEYKNSEEKIREVREWKDRLYAHRFKRREMSDDNDSEGNDNRPMNKQFAPPAMSFAPPPTLNAEPSLPPPPPPPPAPPADLPDDPTGEDAYSRRLRLSQAQQATSANNPVPPHGQIAKPPIRYNLHPPPSGNTDSEGGLESKEVASSPEAAAAAAADVPRSSRPGQAGFAERLLSKYGWTKGSGLGAQGTGIVNPLYAKVDKRKKKSDAEGGGFVTPAQTARIMGGTKSKAAKEEEVGKFGAMSEVIRLEGMLRGLDVEEDVVQEIGEECGEKYGSVQRVFVHWDGAAREEGPLVFVHFVSQLSALRAVNALEGRVFGGNTISARFWERERFEEGNYE